MADVDVPAGANFVNRITTNVGNVISKGVEINLNTTPIKTENLTWDLGINYTYNEAEITNLLKNPDPNFKGQQVSGISGGTGKKFNWQLLKGQNIRKPFFLSGGISPDDAENLKIFQNDPVAKDLFAIDINSKFEIMPGVKDMDKVT